MADIVFKYDEMKAAEQAIRDLIPRYQQAASNLMDSYAGAAAKWEGESKEKMTAFMNGPVNEYVAQTIPQLLTALADILAANASQMANADASIAANIPSSL